MCFLLPFSPCSNLSSSAGDLPKENPYEDVDLKSRRAGRKSQPLSENSLDSLHRMWSPQDRKYNNPPTQVRQLDLGLWVSLRAAIGGLSSQGLGRPPLRLLPALAPGKGSDLRKELCTQASVAC